MICCKKIVVKRGETEKGKLDFENSIILIFLVIA